MSLSIAAYWRFVHDVQRKSTAMPTMSTKTGHASVKQMLSAIITGMESLMHSASRTHDPELLPIHAKSPPIEKGGEIPSVSGFSATGL